MWIKQVRFDLVAGAGKVCFNVRISPPPPITRIPSDDGGISKTMKKEAAETARLGEVLATVGRSLDTFLEFAHPDPQQHPERWRKLLDQPLPETGAGINSVVQEICEQLIPNGAAISRPGFSAYITTSPTTVAMAASCAAMLAAPQRQTLHAFNFLEELSLEWLARLFQLPSEMKGVYSSGGSVANLVALGAARQAMLEQVGINPSADGITRQCVVYSSSETHHTIRRAAGVLGIGRNNVIQIATDDEGRLHSRALAERIQQDLAQHRLPIAIVANAGSTNTGAIDPLYEMGQIAKAHNIWFHIDGAYGLPGILDDRVKPLYRGLELADSVIVDSHKWLGAATGVGATFVRDRDILYRAFTQEPADYLEGSMSTQEVAHSMNSLGIPYSDFATELSSPSRGVVIWALLKEIGAEGIRDRVVRHNSMARQVAARARSHPKLELLLEPTLSICCFRFIAPGIGDLDELNREICHRLLLGNVHLPSTTVVNGKLAIRPCFIGARTSFEYADGLVDEVLRIGSDLIA